MKIYFDKFVNTLFEKLCSLYRYNKYINMNSNKTLKLKLLSTFNTNSLI